VACTDSDYESSPRRKVRSTIAQVGDAEARTQVAIGAAVVNEAEKSPSQGGGGLNVPNQGYYFTTKTACTDHDYRFA
jgi:hypothetical protein